MTPLGGMKFVTITLSPNELEWLVANLDDHLTEYGFGYSSVDLTPEEGAEVLLRLKKLSEEASR